MIYTTCQLLYGAWHVFRLPKPIVSIFGGALVNKDSDDFQKGFVLSGMFADAGISVLTGGGPGIMQAASCGILVDPKAKGRGLGIGVVGVEDKNKCVDNYIILNHLSARKWLLIHYSIGFVIFPGGFGTLNELSELLTSIQTGQLPRVPIVLIGAHYWQPLLEWFKSSALRNGLIKEQDLTLFWITDDLQQAVCLIQKTCQPTSVS